MSANKGVDPGLDPSDAYTFWIVSGGVAHEVAERSVNSTSVPSMKVGLPAVPLGRGKNYRSAMPVNVSLFNPAGPLNPRARRFANPGFGENWLLMPATTLQKKLPDFRHITRMQLQITPAMIVPMAIRGPQDVLDAERREEFTAGEGQRIRSGPLGENRGEQMTIPAAIGPARARLGDHR